MLAVADQTAKQKALRAGLDARARMRKEAEQQHRRRVGHAEAAVKALTERDAATQECEHRAGTALTALIEHEGLSVRDAVRWCGLGLTPREVARLRRIAGQDQDDATAAGAHVQSDVPSDDAPSNDGLSDDVLAPHAEQPAPADSPRPAQLVQDEPAPGEFEPEESAPSG